MDFREQVQEEAEKALLSKDRGSVDLSMRLGKTLIGLRVSKNFNNVLVSYPNIAIKESWISDSEKFGIDISHITFTTHVSLYKHDLSLYDCIILDEVDQVSLKGFEHLLVSNPEIIYGMSGTMPTKGDKAYYIRLLCPIVYRKTLDETTGITNKEYSIYVHLLQPSTKKDIKLSKGGYWSELDRIRFFDKKYQETKKFDFMIKLMHSIAYSETKLQYALKLAKDIERGLIFLETIEQCDKSGFPTYHSKNPDSDQNLEDFQNEKIDKLATVNQLKAGISFRNLKEAVLLHCYSSNNRAAQKIGRCLQFVEGEKATIHIVVLAGTRDEKWANEALIKFDNNKIFYV